MNEDNSIEELKKVVETMLFGESLTTLRRLAAQSAFAELMQKLENATTDSGYSSGYRTGWNDALFVLEKHCNDAKK